MDVYENNYGSIFLKQLLEKLSNDFKVVGNLSIEHLFILNDLE